MYTIHAARLQGYSKYTAKSNIVINSYKKIELKNIK